MTSITLTISTYGLYLLWYILCRSLTYLRA